MTDQTIQDLIEQLRSALADQVTAGPRLLADVQSAIAQQTAGTQAALALAVQVQKLAGQTPDPRPPVGPIPAGSNTVRVGGQAWPLAAVDPSSDRVCADGKRYPGGRGPDELVGYTTAGARTGTNVWGTEVPVAGGVVGTVTVGRDGGITVPAGGVVLSGNGRASTWLQDVCRPGAEVEFVHVDVPGPVVTEPPPRVIAGYLQDGQDVATIPACYNQVRVAFVRMSGGQLTPVEWGGKTPGQTQEQLTQWAQTAGRQVLLSVGGSGGGSNLGDVTGFCNGFRTLAPKYAATGLDYDEEGGTLNVTNAVAIAKNLAKGQESTFTLSFVPPGGDPVAVYLRAAVACQQAGLQVTFGFQGYDAVDSDDDILGRTDDAVTALGERSVVVGFMIGNDPKHRTPAQCESLMRKVVARWKDIGGAYFWRIAAPGTEDAAARVGAVLGL